MVLLLWALAKAMPMRERFLSNEANSSKALTLNTCNRCLSVTLNLELYIVNVLTSLTTNVNYCELVCARLRTIHFGFSNLTFFGNTLLIVFTVSGQLCCCFNDYLKHVIRTVNRRRTTSIVE